MVHIQPEVGHEYMLLSCSKVVKKRTKFYPINPPSILDHLHIIPNPFDPPFFPHFKPSPKHTLKTHT